MPPKDCHFRGIDDYNREFKGESLASNRRYSRYLPISIRMTTHYFPKTSRSTWASCTSRSFRDSWMPKVSLSSSLPSTLVL